MMTSTFLALLFGAYIICVSILMISNRDRLVEVMDDFINSPATLFLTAIMVLLGGLSVVYFHNIWTTDWTVLITLFGWFAAIEGAILLVAPGPLLSLARAILKRPTFLAVLSVGYLLLGLFFLTRVFI